MKAMEESGIGRPSTYASIIQTILRREYSFKKGSALVPTFVAFAVVKLMKEHLGHLIDFNFTAQMEDRLDEIARGESEVLPYLKEFYFGAELQGLRPLLEAKEKSIDPRVVCSIDLPFEIGGEKTIIRVGRYGPFLQAGEMTAPIPDDVCPDEINQELAQKLIDQKAAGPQSLGEDPETDKPVYVKSGRYGPYVQLGDPPEDPKKGEKPKMVSLLRGMEPETMTLEVALKLLSLPRVIGQDADGVDVVAHTGRYGPFLKRGDDTRSVPAEDSLLDLQLPRALEILAMEKRGRGRGAAQQALKTFEEVEALEGKTIKLLKGRYGPYVTDGETNASLPRTYANPEELSEGEAVQLIIDRRAKGPAKKKKKKTKKKAAKKKATKKAAKKKTKKKSAKKKSAKKSAKKATKKKATKKATTDSDE